MTLRHPHVFATLALAACVVEDVPAARVSRPRDADTLGTPERTCRRFAPELPNPRCCPQDFGFDPALVRRACDLDIHLGESWQYSCGHYFHRHGDTVWFRLGELAHASPAKAAAEQAAELQRVFHVPVEAHPWPGLPQVHVVHYDATTWAFLPGRGTTTRLVWPDASCRSEAMGEVLSALLAPPPTALERDG